MVETLNKYTQSLSQDVVLSIEEVAKKFCRNLKQSLWYGVKDIASELTGQDRTTALRPGEFWALKDVSFQLRRGEALGLVGPNGSGKTTLLRIISGLIKPDSGSVKYRGRIAPLIALGAGFNPILTGRENIYANMSILGLSKQQIDDRFDAVVDFAEIGDAIDAPVQSYSSGMAARLGFASAIYTEPDILLIDEVLAVGDIRFRGKCTRRLHHLRQQGTALIMVSHNHDGIVTVCDSGLYLLRGVPLLYGNIRSVMDKYENDLFLNQKKDISGNLILSEALEEGDTNFKVLSLFFRDNQGNPTQSLISGQPTCLVIVFVAKEKFIKVSCNIQVQELSGEGGQILYMNSPDDKVNIEASPGRHELHVQMTSLVLGIGNYTMRVIIRNNKSYLLDRVESFRFLVKKGNGQSYSKFYQQRTWQLVSDSNY